MRKILYLLFAFTILGCSYKITTNGGEENVGNTMLNSINKKFSMQQFDSLCIADTLPRKLSDWKFLGLKEYESNQRVSLFMYMKRDSLTESVYRAEDTMDDSVKIIKRIIVE